MSEGINVIGLFDGMSCGQIALEKVGIPVAKKTWVFFGFAPE